MRTFILLIAIILLSKYGIAQSLDSLSTMKIKLTKQILIIKGEMDKLSKERDSLQIELIKINQEITKLNNISDSTETFTGIINFMGAALRENPDVNSMELIHVSPGDTVLLYSCYSKPFFKAMHNDYIGYISSSSLEKSTKVQSIIDKSLSKEDPKLAALTRQHGSYNASRIINHEYWLGMTDGMALSSLGSPDKINRTTGSFGIHEQWIYYGKDLYLYFEDGILKTIQN